MEEDEYEVEESTESANTLYQLDAAESMSVDDLLYLLQGVGSNRDRKLSLGSLLAWIAANEKFDTVKFVKDENTDIEVKWDSTNSEFVIWQRSNSGTVAVPKLHVHGTLEVEKDATIKADVSITKTLEVTLSAVFNGGIMTKGIDGKNNSVIERVNLVSSKNYFEVTANSTINTLISNSSIDLMKGAVVTIVNSNQTDSVDIYLGTHYPQPSGVATNKKMTLNSLCAMSFVCIDLHSIDSDTPEWAPLGNVTVSWS